MQFWKVVVEYLHPLLNIKVTDIEYLEYDVDRWNMAHVKDWLADEFDFVDKVTIKQLLIVSADSNDETSDE